MALCKTGTFTRSGGISASIKKHLKFFSLEPAKRVTVQFDPFSSSSSEIRHFIYLLNGKKVIQSNPFCKLKTQIVCNRSEPTVEIALINGETVYLKCNHLNTLDIVLLYNQHISVLASKTESNKELTSVKSTK